MRGGIIPALPESVLAAHDDNRSITAARELWQEMTADDRARAERLAETTDPDDPSQIAGLAMPEQSDDTPAAESLLAQARHLRDGTLSRRLDAALKRLSGNQRPGIAGRLARVLLGRGHDAPGIDPVILDEVRAELVALRMRIETRLLDLDRIVARAAAAQNEITIRRAAAVRLFDRTAAVSPDTAPRAARAQDVRHDLARCLDDLATTAEIHARIRADIDHHAAANRALARNLDAALERIEACRKKPSDPADTQAMADLHAEFAEALGYARRADTENPDGP